MSVTETNYLYRSDTWVHHFEVASPCNSTLQGFPGWAFGVRQKRFTLYCHILSTGVIFEYIIYVDNRTVYMRYTHAYIYISSINYHCSTIYNRWPQFAIHHSSVFMRSGSKFGTPDNSGSGSAPLLWWAKSSEGEKSFGTFGQVESGWVVNICGKLICEVNGSINAFLWCLVKRVVWMVYEPMNGLFCSIMICLHPESQLVLNRNTALKERCSGPWNSSPLTPERIWNELKW